jgi:hypothetical protein
MMAKKLQLKNGGDSSYAKVRCPSGTAISLANGLSQTVYKVGH